MSNHRNAPLEVLGLGPTTTLDELKTRWRALASQHHPDRGGDAAVFHTLRQAYEAARQQLITPLRCEVCHGTGKLTRTQGFHSCTTWCPTCRGRGVN